MLTWYMVLSFTWSKQHVKAVHLPISLSQVCTILQSANPIIVNASTLAPGIILLHPLEAIACPIWHATGNCVIALNYDCVSFHIRLMRTSIGASISLVSLVTFNEKTDTE